MFSFFFFFLFVSLMCSECCHVLQVINPPLFGVIAGVVIGLSPAGPLLFLAPSPSAPSMPFELRIVVGEQHLCLFSCLSAVDL